MGLLHRNSEDRPCEHCLQHGTDPRTGGAVLAYGSSPSPPFTVSRQGYLHLFGLPEQLSVGAQQMPLQHFWVPVGPHDALSAAFPVGVQTPFWHL